MTSILITPKTKSELELLSRLLKKLKIAAFYFYDEEKEDIGLRILMQEADRTKTTNKSKIMRNLRAKTKTS